MIVILIGNMNSQQYISLTALSRAAYQHRTHQQRTAPSKRTVKNHGLGKGVIVKSSRLIHQVALETHFPEHK